VQRSFLLVLACIYSLVCLSQDERQYAFAHYGTDKGLSGYDVRAVVQDEDGYMWVGTSTGLQRFDGTRFLTFYHRKNDSTSIPENSITQLFRCKKNKLWVLTASGKAGVFDTKHFRFKPVSIQPAKKSSLVADKKFFTDSHGNIYLLCFKSELLVYSEKDNRFISAANKMPLPANWLIISFCEDETTGKYYIGTDSGMVVYNLKTQKQSYSGHNVENELLIEQYGRIRFVAPMLLDSKQRLWFLTWPPNIGGPYFFCFNLQNKTTLLKQYSFFPLIKEYYEPNAMMEQHNGTVWIKGGNIFARYLDKENKFQLVHNGYTNDQSIAFETVWDLHEDREENLWVATNNNGLYRFNPSEEYFLNVHHNNRIKNTPGEGSALSFIEDNGTILMGAWGNGIYRYDSNFNNIPVGIKGIAEKNSVVVWHMLQANDGRTIWMGTQPGGLYKYDRKTRSARYYAVPAIENSTVCQLAEDRNGNLWIGTYSRGLYKYTKTGQGYDFTRHVEKINAVDARTINALCYDSSGNLMVATNTNGVYVIDTSTNRVLHHFSTEGPANQRLPGIQATAICNYNDTTILIGCSGINIYNPVKQTIQSIRMANSRPNDVAAIQKDRNGYIWITQSTGLLRFSLSKKNIVIVFDRIDGIINDHFIPGASASLADGRLLFGSSNQFIVFDPQHIDLVDSLPDVAITGFKVQDKSLLVDSLRNLKIIELEPTENNITIDLSSLMYCSTSIIKYKLEGIDKDWIRTDISNQAVYPYLPHGTYTFKAITEDSEGTPGKNTTTLVIKVKPLYWQTWWFFGIILFVCLGIFLWFDRLRMLKIKATESVRNRIANSLTEDMGNSLSSINITSELAKTKIDSDTERTKEYIIQISDSSNRMVQAMYDMVWSINPENDTLQHTVDRMKNYAAEMESMYTPSIIFQIDEQAKDVRLSMETRYEMLSIYKEAVNNAARHAQAKYIEVNLRYKKPALILCIRDDGKGFDAELVELSRGLSEMRRRAATINAKLTLKSEINTGTSVKLVMSK
jgi:ligand-binding sensor domain-containing protein/two-component sensor histidine kinase